MSLGGLGLKPVEVKPQFVFGVNGKLTNSLHMLEDKKLLYVAGHNVIIYNIDDKTDKTQEFIPGSEGTEGINFVTVSPSNKFMAVCERGERAKCMIYDIMTIKLKKILPEQDTEIEQVQCKEFVSCAFSSKQEKNHLITLCDEPVRKILLWEWDKLKVLAEIDLIFTGALPEKDRFNFTCSFNPNVAENVMVTGPNCYMYLTVIDSNQKFRPEHSKLAIDDAPQGHSTNYLGHQWTKDGMKVIIISDNGDIYVASMSGDYMCHIAESPCGIRLECVYTFSRGIIVAGQNGYIYNYEATSQENTPNQYKLMRHRLEAITGETELQQIGNDVKSLALSQGEDQLYFITKNNQFMKINVALDGTDIEQAKFEHVHCSFHKKEITGLDVCIRKQLIVTCSRDKHINIWNYATRTLELSQPQAEECLAVAFHPSGFHLVVSLQDKIQMMNVLSKQIIVFKTITQKGCREVRFSHGGHLFACATSPNSIHVYNFYTGDCPQNMQCTGHMSKVRGIDWFEDDMGFASCAGDGFVFFYDLQFQRENNSRQSEQDFNQRGVQFTGVCLIPQKKDRERKEDDKENSKENDNEKYRVFVVGGDKNLWRNIGNKDSSNARVVLSQVQVLNSGKALFAGVGQEGLPGAIQIWNTEPERIAEVQAHSMPITRMRISFDNNSLFTAGEDGTLIIHEITDRDPRGGSSSIKRDRDGGLPNFSEEILTEKSEMEGYVNDRDNLEQELNNAKDPANSGVESKMGTAGQEDIIARKTEELSTFNLRSRHDMDQLQNQKAELADQLDKQTKELAQKHSEILENKRNEYSHKMLAEAKKFKDLKDQKDEENKKFERAIQNVFDEHNSETNKSLTNHNDFMEIQKNQVAQLKADISSMQEDNKETMDQIQDDAKLEISDITDKYQEHEAHTKEMALKAKADLQLTRNKLADTGSEIENAERDINDRKLKLEQQLNQITELKESIKEQGKEIDQKDSQISVRERQIYNLKKKTQELEKFRFVLDYKIRDLNKEIAPRELIIGKLRSETNDMDKKLRHFNGINANLGVIVDDLRTRMEHLMHLIKQNRLLIRRNETYISGFRTAVHNVANYIDEFDQLKRAVHSSLYHYITDHDRKSIDLDPDIKKEYENQVKYLQNAVHSLKKRLDKETQIHKEDNLSIMQENIALIKSITELRSENTSLNQKIKKFGKRDNNDEFNKSKQGSRKNLQGKSSPETQQQLVQMLKHDLQTKHEYLDKLKESQEEILTEIQMLQSEMAEQ